MLRIIDIGHPPHRLPSRTVAAATSSPTAVNPAPPVTARSDPTCSSDSATACHVAPPSPERSTTPSPTIAPEDPLNAMSRRCLDRLKSARAQRETYPGAWLPEPVIEPEAGDGDDLTLTLMVAHGRLSPLERAAFLLHDVFGLGFDEVAGAIARDPAACRQLATRARAHVRDARPRFPVPEARGRDLADAFLAASRSGDVA